MKPAYVPDANVQLEPAFLSGEREIENQVLSVRKLYNRCLHFAPGTHRCGMLNGRQLEPFLPDLDSGRWPSVPVPMRPGSVSFHHSLTLHSSGPNQTAKRRRGNAVHYMRATSIKDEGVTDAPQMPRFKQVRGNLIPGRV